MTRWSYQALLAASAAVATLGLLTGCSPATSAPTVTRTVTAPAPSTTVPAPPTSTPTSASTDSDAPAPPATKATQTASSTSEVDPGAPTGQCADSALKVSVQYDGEAAGAGQRGAFVVFQNLGNHPCHLDGTPGLSLVGDGNGTQIGRPAQRDTSGATLVTVAPGEVAQAQVEYTYVDEDGGVYGDGHGQDPTCKAEVADAYRIYPPHSYRAYFSAYKTYGCTTGVHWITVSPVRPASDFKYFTPEDSTSPAQPVSNA